MYSCTVVLTLKYSCTDPLSLSSSSSPPPTHLCCLLPRQSRPFSFLPLVPYHDVVGFCKKRKRRGEGGERRKVDYIGSLLCRSRQHSCREGQGQRDRRRKRRHREWWLGGGKWNFQPGKDSTGANTDTGARRVAGGGNDDSPIAARRLVASTSIEHHANLLLFSEKAIGACSLHVTVQIARRDITGTIDRKWEENRRNRPKITVLSCLVITIVYSLRNKCGWTWSRRGWKFILKFLISKNWIHKVISLSRSSR